MLRNRSPFSGLDPIILLTVALVVAAIIAVILSLSSTPGVARLWTATLPFA